MGWGDELMVTGQARERQARDPRRVRVVYERPRWHPAWDHNPRIARLDETGDFQELVARDGYLRPYIARKEGDRWTWRAWGPPRGELYFTPDELDFGAQHAGHIIVEPNLKNGAPVAKQWGWVRWNKLAWLMNKRGIRLAQLGDPTAPRLDRVEVIRTPTMRHAAAVLARAAAAVLPEGGLHHVAAAVGTPAVVIFGGYIAPAVTGYADQVNLFPPDARWPLGCGSRHRCEHCAAAMVSIAPEAVAKELEKLLERSSDEAGRRRLAARA